MKNKKCESMDHPALSRTSQLIPFRTLLSVRIKLSSVPFAPSGDE